MSNIVPMPSPDWKASLMRFASGTAQGNLANACTMLREAPDLQLMLAYDAFSMQTLVVAPPPWEYEPASFRQRNWSGQDDLLITEHMQKAGLPVKVQTAAQAVEVVARERSFHPVLDYLGDLKWDGRARLDRFFARYFGASDDVYTSNIGRHFMIGAVARIQQPGVKNDHTPIIEGKQGLGKSKAARCLFDPWYSDEVADLGSKDAAMQVSGVWGVELSELDAYSRAEVGRIKAWMTRTTDRFRPPYGTRIIESPRSCVFLGTTNGDSYLKDETGNRRFWPVRATRVDIDALTKDRDQLWAEAQTYWQRGIAWWLVNPEAIEQARQEQLARVVDDPWDGIVGSFIAHMNEVTVAEVLSDALHIDRSRWTQNEQNRIARCLKARGWERVQVRAGDKRSWKYRRGETAS